MEVEAASMIDLNRGVCVKWPYDVQLELILWDLETTVDVNVVPKFKNFLTIISRGYSYRLKNGQN